MKEHTAIASGCVSYLAGAHRAPITVQHPDLPTVLDLVVMDTVAGAVVSVGTAAVVASLQVEAHRVVGAGVPPRLAFINICSETWHHTYVFKKKNSFNSTRSIYLYSFFFNVGCFVWDFQGTFKHFLGSLFCALKKIKAIATLANYQPFWQRDDRQVIVSSSIQSLSRIHQTCFYSTLHKVWE